MPDETIPENIQILIIDDERVIRDGCERALSRYGYQVRQAENGAKGIDCLKASPFQVVLLDLMMPGIDGFAVLEWIKENRPDIQVIVITGFATVEKAVAAMKKGAFDFVGKPFTPDYIRIVVERALEKSSLVAETLKLRQEKSLDLAIIMEEQSRIKTVFSCMEEAVLVTNHEGVVVLHNPAAIKVLDIQTDPVVGKKLSASVRDKNALAMVEKCITEGTTVTREFPSGTISRLFLRAHCAPVRTTSGQTLGSVTVFEDVTAHKKIDQLKSDFVAMVAHELRAPLASIEQMIYAIQTCYRNADQERQDHLLGRITVRTKDLLQLIENLLNLSKLETGTMIFNLEPARGDEIIRNMIEIVQPQAESKEIALTFEPAPEEWWINVDPDHIRGVFTNIIGNAVKYTPNGRRVTVSSTVASGLAVIKVVDSGIGISREDLPHLFDRFFRVKNRVTRGITGSGLGLSVVKEVVEAHQGYMEVTSELDRGTTFTIHLPLVDPPL